MKLSPAGKERYRRETVILLAKMLAIAMPIGLAGVAIIASMILFMEGGYWIAVFAVGIPVVLTAVFFCVLFAAETYIKPLIRIDEFCSRLRSGDFTALEDVEGAGVMREVASTLNEMSSALKDFTTRAGDSSRKLAEASDTLLTITENSNANLQDISRALLQLNSETEEQQRGVARVESCTGVLLENIRRVEEAARQAMEFSEQVKLTVGQGAEAVSRAVVKMQEIRDSATRLASLVGELDEHSGEIGMIIEVISSIADETKLLSLNAAIEAARAGEQGRGFSVVAGEVRRLAEGSSSAAKQIEKLVNEIRSLVSKSAGAMEEASGRVEEGMEVSARAREMLSRIDASSREITRYIGSVIEATQAMGPVNREMSEAVRSIAVISEAVAGNMQEISSSLREQAATMEEITTLMHELDEVADGLKAVIDAHRPPE